MNNKFLRLFLLVVALPFASAVTLYFISLFVIKYIQLPPCIFHLTTGLYCPGCGSTRSVIALVHGDIILSLRQNPIVITALIYAALLYIEPVAKALGKSDFRSPVRSYKALGIVLAALFVYSIIRNFVPVLAPISV